MCFSFICSSFYFLLFPNRLLGVGLSLGCCLCIKKFETELGSFWRDILLRGRGLGLDRFWSGWVGPFLVGLGWIVFGRAGLDHFWLDKGLAKKTNSNFFSP